MDMEYWCEFAVVAQRKSYSRTAEEMNISQSSLSKHVMALERELGVTLFDRTSRRVELSPAGELFLPMALEIQEQYRRVRLLAEQQHRKDRITVSIASIPVMAQYGITQTVADFQRHHQEAVLEVQECESIDIPPKLSSGECELAFTRDCLSPELEGKLFCRDHLVAVLHWEHPLAHFSKLSLADLAEQDFLLMDKGTSLYSLCIDHCRRAGFTPKVCYTGHRPENILGLVASGMGVALLMDGHTRFVKTSGVVLIPIEPRVESPIYIVRKKGVRLSPFAKEFWDSIGEAPTGQ